MNIKAIYHKLFAISILIVGVNQTIFAQQNYTLEQCIEIALEQSLQLKSDALDLDQTNASIRQAYSAVLPHISINGSYQFSPQVQASIIPAETFGGPVGTYSVAKLGIAQTKSASAELSQTIFNPSAFISLKAAKLMVSGNDLQVKSTKENLVYNITATYYAIQSILKQEELTGQNIQNTDSLLKITIESLDAGLTTQTDVDRLTVTRENTLAGLESLRNNKEKYYNLLKVLMNIKLKESITIEQFSENESVNATITEVDITQKTNYQQLVYQKQMTEFELKNAKSGYMPSLSFFANYGYYGYYDNANPFKIINDRFYPSSSIGVRLNVPIFDGLYTKNLVEQKKIELQKIDVMAEQVTQQNEQAVADALADLRSNLITYENQQRNLELAQKVMKDINHQYQLGLVNVTDIINTTKDLQTAENNYLTALINIKLAELNLKQAQGTLLN